MTRQIATAPSAVSLGKASLWLISGSVVFLIAIPIVWLLIKASEGDGASLLTELFTVSNLRLVGRSLLLAALVSAVSVMLGLALAWLSTVSDLSVRTRSWVHLLSVAPLAVPCYVGASTYLAALAPRGPIGRLLTAVSLPAPDIYGLGGAVFVLTLFIFPLAYLPLRAALLRCDGAVWEAARVLGQGPWSAFWLAVWPQLRGAAVAGGSLVALYAMAEFGAVALLHYDSFPRVIYLQFHSALDFTAAARSSLLLVTVIVFLLLLTERLRGRGATSSERDRPLHVPLGRLLPAALFLAFFTALAAVGIPLLTVIWWLTAHPFVRLGWLQEALLTSTLTGVAAATVSVALAFVMAWLAVRHKSRLSVVLIRVVELGYSLPGLIVALGLTFFTLSALPAFYQGWTQLLAAYVILFAALGTSTLRSALERLPPSLEEAARMLGRSSAAATREITLPLMRPGVAAAFLLVWLSVMKELPATMLLVPAGHASLATRLWSFTDEAMYAEAALPALVLIIVAGLGVLLVRRRLETL